MKMQFVILGIVVLLISVGLSGCNEISNVFLTNEDKLIGTWNSEGIWFDVPTVIVFSSNGTFKLELEMGIPLPIDLSLSKGKWDMKNGILMLELVDLIPPTNYTYQFSEESKILTLTDMENSDSYILRKQ